MSLKAPLDGRVALVTGSTSGLGKAIAFALGQAGAKVALNFCHDEQRAAQVFSEFEQAGHQGILARASVIEEDEVRQLSERVRGELGGIDIVVVNATPAQPQKPIEDYEWDDYRSMLDFFVKSPYLLARALLPHMKAQRWGRIVNIGSEVFDRGTAQLSAYVAAKGAQNGWTRSMASELAPWGITVNMVSPGWIPGERHEAVPQRIKDKYLASIPIGRWGSGRDVAGAVTYFAGDAAAFVTGQVVVVNGGLSLG